MIPESLPLCEFDSSFHLPHKAPLYTTQTSNTVAFKAPPMSGNLIAFVNHNPIFQAKTRPQRAHNPPPRRPLRSHQPKPHDELTSTFTGNAAQPSTRTRHTRNHPPPKQPRNLHTSHGHDMHRRAQRPSAGGGHHTPTHYVPEPETYYLISHAWRGCVVAESVAAVRLRCVRFRVGQKVVLDHSLDFASFNDSGVREKRIDGPFGVVAIAYSDDRAS
jgi:hypothetical protein